MVRCALVPVVTMAALDHDDPVAMMTPAMMPAVVTMHAVLGTRRIRAVVMTALDHHRLRAGERRRRDRESAEGRNHITKLLHDVLLQSNANLNGAFA